MLRHNLSKNRFRSKYYPPPLPQPKKETKKRRRVHKAHQEILNLCDN